MGRRAKSGSLLLAALALGCGSTTSGLGDAGGSDQAASCVGVCGMVTGILPDVPQGCTFTPPCSPPNAFTGLIVFVEGQVVPEDPTMTEGWEFTDIVTATFQLYGQACGSAASTFVDYDYTCELASTAP
jgi:hypothetical protein